VSEAVRAELHGTPIEVSCVLPGIVNTELTSGVQPARFVKNIEPTDVADAIVGALERPHFDVYVPKAIGPINKVMMLLPRAGREALARALKADKVMVDFDANARRAYELRASNSEPGLEPADAPKQLSETT
jgi:short-subunit dehydrogenase